MSPTIKDLGSGFGVQCTKQARSAGLAMIDRPDNEQGTVSVQGERVRVGSVNGLVVAAGVEAVTPTEFLELVDNVLRDRAGESLSALPFVQLVQSGEGVALPMPDDVLADASVDAGDSAAVDPLPGVLIVTPQSEATTRLVSDLRTIREEQL